MRDHPPIPITDLADNIERLKANDGLKFSQEYEVRRPYLCMCWAHPHAGSCPASGPSRGVGGLRASLEHRFGGVSSGYWRTQLLGC